MELISETFVGGGGGLMSDGVPNVFVFVGDWNQDTFNDVGDVLDARLLKWGSVFPYGLKMLIP